MIKSVFIWVCDRQASKGCGCNGRDQVMMTERKERRAQGTKAARKVSEKKGIAKRRSNLGEIGRETKELEKMLLTTLMLYGMPSSLFAVIEYHSAQMPPHLMRVSVDSCLRSFTNYAVPN